MDRILIIDDDFELCSLVTEYLAAEGFRVESVHDGETGLKRATAGGYLLVILDVMLPGMSGFDVLRRLRATSRIPVLLLTARGEDVDRIVGLEIGADDYLPKPFNPRELVARIRAILRRSAADRKAIGSPRPPEVLRIGDIELDPATRTVRHGRATGRAHLRRIQPAGGPAARSGQSRHERAAGQRRPEPQVFTLRSQHRHARQQGTQEAGRHERGRGTHQNRARSGLYSCETPGEGKDSSTR